jgi:pectinesterase
VVGLVLRTAKVLVWRIAVGGVGVSSKRRDAMRMTWIGLALMCGVAGAQGLKVETVAAAGAQFTTVQDAVNAAPDAGAEIKIAPGEYREVVHVDKANIHLRGQGGDPAKVVIVYANGASNTCGTSCSATMFVTGDGFIATGLTIANDWSKTGKPRTQAVALEIWGDKAVLRDVRLLGAQDTLYALSKGGKISREYYDHCYIEGEVDFIFGNAKAVFHDCEIHSIPHNGGFLTANGRAVADEDSGYVFDHCRLTADPEAGVIFLGRPWRDYAKVTYLDTEMGAQISPEGWSEWHKGETNRLTTAVYQEYGSTGPGGDMSKREPLAIKLTKEQAEGYRAKAYLKGADGWDPTVVK